MKFPSAAPLILLAALFLAACSVDFSEQPASQPAEPAAPAEPAEMEHIALPIVARGAGGNSPASTEQIFLPDIGQGGLPTSAWQLAPQQIDASQPEQRYTLIVTAPSIQSVPEGEFEPFNQAVRGFVDSQVAAFRDLLTQANQDQLLENGGMAQISYQVASAPGDRPVQPGLVFASSPTALAPEQVIFQGGHDILSIYFETSAYTGGAHPNQYHTTLNYDLTTGRVLTLADLFRPGIDAVQSVADYCINDLRQRQDMLFPDYATSGAAPRPENYQAWNVTSLGLLITFDEYQVAPYAAGPQTVLIPYPALETLLDPLGPLGLLAK